MFDKVSKHFYRSEFKCKCGKCNYQAVDIEGVELLEGIREHFNASKIIINSGWRCKDWNIKVGGSEHSKHMLGIAYDIKVFDSDGNQISPRKIAEYVDYLFPNSHGIGIYKTFTHIDLRNNRARWTN